MTQSWFNVFVVLFFVPWTVCSASLCSDVGYLAAKCTNKNGQVSVFFLRPGAQCTCTLSASMVPIPSWLYNSVKGAATVACTNDLVLAPSSSSTQISKNGVQLTMFQRCDTSPVTGDPHLIGFEGTKFEFGGFTGGVFNLITERSHQLNVLLDDFGVADATYIREVGFMFGDSLKMAIKAEVDALELPAQASTAVEVNGATVKTTGMNTSTVVIIGGASKATITVSSAAAGGDLVQVVTDTFEITIERQAGALHLDLGASVLAPTLLHGVLGQTLHWTEGSKFEGDEADYVVSSLFASDFKFNLFQGVMPKAGNARALLALPKPTAKMAQWRKL